jgi:hypothetical protein
MKPAVAENHESRSEGLTPDPAQNAPATRAHIALKAYLSIHAARRWPTRLPISGCLATGFNFHVRAALVRLGQILRLREWADCQQQSECEKKISHAGMMTI